MSKTAINKFTNGLTLDTHPLVSMDTSLTNCLNGTLMTMDGNELILQNDSGNILTDCVIKDGFIPIGMKEYNGVIYIVSVNPTTNEGAIGSYPSPNYEKIGKTVEWKKDKIELPSNMTPLILIPEEKQIFSAGDTLQIFDFLENYISEFNKKYNSSIYGKQVIKISGAEGSSLYNLDLSLINKRDRYSLNDLFLNSFVLEEFTIPTKISGYPSITISLNGVKNIYVTDYTGLNRVNDDGKNEAVGSGILHLLIDEKSFPVAELETVLSESLQCYYEYTNNSGEIKNDPVKIVELESYFEENDEMLYKFTFSRQTNNEFDKNIICNKLIIKCTANQLGFDSLNGDIDFYNNTFQLTTEGLITDPLSIIYFKYTNEDDLIKLIYKYLLYNFQENGTLNIYKSIDGQSLELITSKTLQESPALSLFTEKLTLSNEYQFIVFTKVIDNSETLVDIQYIIPFQQSTYLDLNYSNFRKDIEDPNKNVGRDVIVKLTPKNGKLSLEEDEILIYDSAGVKIEPWNDEIILNASKYEEQIKFKIGLLQANIDDSYLPNISCLYSNYNYNILDAELRNGESIITDFGISTNVESSLYSLRLPLKISTYNCDITQYIQIGTALIHDVKTLYIKQYANGELAIEWNNPNPKTVISTTVLSVNLNRQIAKFIHGTSGSDVYKGFVYISIVQELSSRGNNITQSSILSEDSFNELCFLSVGEKSSSAYIFKYNNGYSYNGLTKPYSYLFYSSKSAKKYSEVLSTYESYDDLYLTSKCTLNKYTGIMLGSKLITDPIVNLVSKYNSDEIYIKNYINEEATLTAKIETNHTTKKANSISCIRVSTDLNTTHYFLFDDTNASYIRFNVDNNKVETPPSNLSLVSLGNTDYLCSNKDQKTWRIYSGDVSSSDSTLYNKYTMILNYDNYDFNTLYSQ